MDDLRLGKAVTRRYRNRRIGEFLKELDLAEGRSTGVPKILRAMRNNGSPPPSFETDEDRSWFLVRLAVHPSFSNDGRDAAEQDTQQDKQLENKEKIPDTVQATVQVEQLLLALERDMHRQELQDQIGIANRTHFLAAYLKPALETGLIEMTDPEAPTSPKQRYRRTSTGNALARKLMGSGK